MRFQVLIWTGVTVHFLVMGALYLAVGGEAAGGSLLFLGAGLGGLVAGWAWSWHRQHPQDRAQDRPDADVTDEVGVVGVFPAASLRPLALAVGMSAIVLGVPLGSWMTMAGVAIVASQVALLVRDADR